MPEPKGTGSYLRPDIGEGTTTDLGKSVVPFKDLNRTAEREGIVLQIRVLTSDDAEGVRVMGAVENALRGIVVGGKPVVAVLTRDNLEITYADAERLANTIAPLVLRRLGVRDGIGGAVMTGLRG